MSAASGTLRAGKVAFGPASSGNNALTIDANGHVQHQVGVSQNTDEAYPALKRSNYDGRETGSFIDETTYIQEAVQILDTWNLTYLLDSPPAPYVTSSATTTDVTITIELSQKEAGFADVFLPRVDTLSIELFKKNSGSASDDYASSLNIKSIEVENNIDGKERSSSQITFSAIRHASSNTVPAFEGTPNAISSYNTNYGVVRMNPSAGNKLFDETNPYWIAVYYTNRNGSRNPQKQFHALNLNTASPPDTPTSIATTGVSTTNPDTLTVESNNTDNGTMISHVTYFLVPDTSYGSNNSGSYRFHSNISDDHVLETNSPVIGQMSSGTDGKVNITGLNTIGKFFGMLGEDTDIGFTENSNLLTNPFHQIYEVVDVSVNLCTIKRVGAAYDINAPVSFSNGVGNVKIIEAINRSVTNSNSETGTYDLRGSVSDLNWLTRYRIQAQATNNLGSAGGISIPPPEQAVHVTGYPSSERASVEATTINFPNATNIKTAGTYHLINVDANGAYNNLSVLSPNNLKSSSGMRIFAPSSDDETVTANTTFGTNNDPGVFGSQTDSKILDLSVKITAGGSTRSQSNVEFYAFDVNNKHNSANVTAITNGVTKYNNNKDILTVVTGASDVFASTNHKSGMWLQADDFTIKLNGEALFDDTNVMTALRNIHDTTIEGNVYSVSVGVDEGGDIGIAYNPQVTSSKTSITSKTLPRLYFSNSNILSNTATITVTNINLSSFTITKVSGLDVVSSAVDVTSTCTISNLFGNIITDNQKNKIITTGYTANGTTISGKDIAFSTIASGLTDTQYNGGTETWGIDVDTVDTNVSISNYSVGFQSDFAARKWDDGSATATQSSYTDHIFDTPSLLVMTNTHESVGIAYTTNQRQYGLHVRYKSASGPYSNPIEKSTGINNINTMPNPGNIQDDLAFNGSMTELYDHTESLLNNHNQDAQLANGRFGATLVVNSTSSKYYQNYSNISSSYPDYSSISNKNRYHCRAFHPGQAGVTTSNTRLQFVITYDAASDFLIGELSNYVNAYYYIYSKNNADQTTGWMSLQSEFEIGKYGVPSSSSMSSYPYGQSTIGFLPGGRVSIVKTYTAGTGTITFQAQGKSGTVYNASENIVVLLLLELKANSNPLLISQIKCTPV